MKQIVILLAALMITLCSFSQESYGVRAGINMSNLNFKSNLGAEIDTDYRYGVAFGGFVNWYLSKEIFLYTEVQYSAEGAKDEGFRADYVQLPVMVRLYVIEDLAVGLGPIVSLKIWNFEDAFSPFTFGAVAGAEYLITDEIFVDARVNYGFTNVLDKDLDPVEATNFAFQLGVGIKIF